jgi:hypothetical protein
MSSLQNLAKCEKPLEYTERSKKKGISDKIAANTNIMTASCVYIKYVHYMVENSPSPS